MRVPESFDASIAHGVGAHADAVLIPAGHDQVIVSGTPGTRPDGTVPDSVDDEAAQAWRNVLSVLELAGAGITDVVAVRQWLTDANDIPAYLDVRARFLPHEPASMLAVVPALARPGFRIVIEAVAVLPPPD